MGLSRRPCFRHLCRNPDDRSLISRSERKIPSIVAAVTIEQCWHRVPGGTAVAACRVLHAMAEFPDVRSIGLASWHRRPIPAAFDPGIPVRHAPIPGPLLYDAWALLHAPGPNGSCEGPTWCMPPPCSYHPLESHSWSPFTTWPFCMIRACSHHAVFGSSNEAWLPSVAGRIWCCAPRPQPCRTALMPASSPIDSGS